MNLSLILDFDAIFKNVFANEEKSASLCSICRALKKSKLVVNHLVLGKMLIEELRICHFFFLRGISIGNQIGKIEILFDFEILNEIFGHT